MRDAQQICNELFASTAYIAMANFNENSTSIEIARNYSLKLFPKEMIDNAEIELQEKLRSWDRIHINQVRL